MNINFNYYLPIQVNEIEPFYWDVRLKFEANLHIELYKNHFTANQATAEGKKAATRFRMSQNIMAINLTFPQQWILWIDLHRKPQGSQTRRKTKVEIIILFKNDLWLPLLADLFVLWDLLGNCFAVMRTFLRKLVYSIN